ncbi:DNA-binding protein [Nonomuraea sp. NPDC050540]|uniref:DNA-binding protein n=1 Tax=Nonomuraea sp. NPDC050540 TaxID=3364367 RepID=UPI00378A5248
MTRTTPTGTSATETGEVPGVPEVVGLLTAGRLLGIGRTKAYQLAKAGAFPCRVLRIGGRYAVPIRGLRALLDHPEQHNDAITPSPDSSSRPAAPRKADHDGE